MHIDASGTKLGTVLAQKDDIGKDITEPECLAVLWVVEYFCHYFGLDLFVVVTDHAALKCLQTVALIGHRALW
ncbi:11258_t:CDS:2, partial [Dentiscutata erythropus]